MDLHGLEVSGERLNLNVPGTILMNGFLSLTKGCHVNGSEIEMRRLTIQCRTTAVVVRTADQQVDPLATLLQSPLSLSLPRSLARSLCGGTALPPCLAATLHPHSSHNFSQGRGALCSVIAAHEYSIM